MQQKPSLDTTGLCIERFAIATAAGSCGLRGHRLIRSSGDCQSSSTLELLSLELLNSL